MLLEVSKEDIKNIGIDHFNDTDTNFLIVVSNGEICGIEEIILRNILKDFGENYKIVKTEDYFKDGNFDVWYYTNLPYEIYQKVYKKKQ